MRATAIAATVPDASLFRSGRDFAAWLGLVPRQYSTGGKTRLGRTSKMGDERFKAQIAAALKRRAAPLPPGPKPKSTKDKRQMILL